VRVLLCAVSAAIVAGCSPNLSVSQQQFGTSRVIIAPGNLRLVTERIRDGIPVVCTEPSPDYAVAFNNKINLSVARAAPTGASPGNSTVSSEMTEQVHKGGGREAAILALRDGLYAACQAYANGVIGQDAYSLVLSQYGTLLAAIVNPPKDGAQTTYGNDGVAALLTACVSAYDPSRIPQSRNMLLDPVTCRRVLVAAAGGAR